MTGETQNKLSSSINSGRAGYDRNKRSRGNFNKGDSRGSRGMRGNDNRGSNRRNNDTYAPGYESRNTSTSYYHQKQYYNKDANEHFRQNNHVAKFDGNTLSDLNEFPDFNHCETNNGALKNYRKSDNRGSSSNREVKSLNWNGRDQLPHLAPKVVDTMHVDNRSYNRGYNEPPRFDERVYDNSQQRSNRGSNSVGYSRNSSRQYQRRSLDSPRRTNTRHSIPLANSPPATYEDHKMAATPPIELISLYNNARFVSPPSMEGYECMPGDTLQDHDESNFYKVKVNDDTLDLTMRIIYQLEFYFSNFNLKTDSFLREQMDPNGYIEFDTIATFPRMMRLKASKEELVEAVNKSDKLECDATVEMLRRIDSPDKWTNNGLFNEIFRIYTSYVYDVQFASWYSKAQEYIKGFPAENQKSGQFSDVPPVNFPVFPMFLDIKSGTYIPSFMLPYGAWPGFEYMEQNEMDMSMTGFTLTSYDEDSMAIQPRSEKNLSPDLYDPTANEKFKEMVSARAVTDDNGTACFDHNSENIKVDSRSSDVKLQTTDTLENSDRLVQSEADEYMMNPKDLRNFRISSKSKHAPVKYDRHSAIQHKNMKVETQRDIGKQVEMGIKSYEHEQNKHSTSVHGALSQNPEAPAKVYIADGPLVSEGQKELNRNLPVVVDGTRIITDKNVIEKAYAMYNKGVQEPIPVAKQAQGGVSVNGFKDAAGNREVRKDNKKQNGVKARRVSGGPKPRGPPK